MNLFLVIPLRFEQIRTRRNEADKTFLSELCSQNKMMRFQKTLIVHSYYTCTADVKDYIY